MEFRFERESLTLDEVRLRAADLWSDLAFDEPAHARLKRDGLMLDGLRLTGPIPFVLTQDEGDIIVTIAPVVADSDQAATLLDLWRIHFMKGLRLGNLSA